MKLSPRPLRLADDIGSAVVHLDAQGRLRVHAAGVQERLAARLHGHSLTCSLAAGVSPEASVLLALRAQILTSPATRRMLAGSLSRVVSRPATAVPIRRGPAVSSWRGAAICCEDDWQHLITLLLAPVPVSAQGVAQVWLLVTDGTGPLYNSRSATELCAAVVQATTALDPAWAMRHQSSGW